MQPNQQDEKSFIPSMRGLPFLLWSTMIVFLIFTGLFWISTHQRISDLETKLSVFADRLDRLPDKKSYGELDHTMKEFKALKSEHLEWERKGQFLNGNSKEQKVATNLSNDLVSNSKNGRQRKTVNSEASSAERVEAPLFANALQSLYRSLELSPKRRSELGTALEGLLDSIWPEYVALTKSDNADSASLQQLYCLRAQSILTIEEVQRLGC